MNDVAEWLKEGSGWTTDGVLENYFNLVNYKPLEGKSYIPLPKELQNSLKGSINLKMRIMNVSVGVILAGLPRARSARGTEPHTHGIWSTSFRLVVT